MTRTPLPVACPDHSNRSGFVMHIMPFLTPYPIWYRGCRILSFRGCRFTRFRFKFNHDHRNFMPTLRFNTCCMHVFVFLRVIFLSPPMLREHLLVKLLLKVFIRSWVQSKPWNLASSVEAAHWTSIYQCHPLRYLILIILSPLPLV